MSLRPIAKGEVGVDTLGHRLDGKLLEVIVRITRIEINTLLQREDGNREDTGSMVNGTCEPARDSSVFRL